MDYAPVVCDTVFVARSFTLSVLLIIASKEALGIAFVMLLIMVYIVRFIRRNIAATDREL